jgi:cyclophilin family peptidyl-prolyl cis-trans isomerase
VLRRFLTVTLLGLFVTGLVYAEDKVEPKKEEQPKKVEQKMEKKNPIVEMQTNLGTIYLEVFEKETPIHAGNFLSKVDAGKYNSLTFHRIVPNFVIQGGDPRGNGTGSMDGPALADEKSPFPEVRGTVAMARSDSASNCQFYINLKDNLFLDQQKFASFAKVVKGMDVVDKIAAVKTGPNDKPLEPVVMTKLMRVGQIPTGKVIEKKTTEPDKKAIEPDKKGIEPMKKPMEPDKKAVEPEKKSTEPEKKSTDTK